MFCPNCGTKNDDSAQKCGQCGFDQKPKGAAPKHKGTVMMTGSPVANLGTDKPKPNPNLKGTMVGVAPPDLSGALPGGAKQPATAPSSSAAAASSAAVAAARPSPNLKGTMVGVAPPGIDDLKKQAAASNAAATNAAPQPAKAPPASLKGTMIGLAPPNMGAEVEAAKAKLAARKAEAAEARAASEGVPGEPAGGNEPTASKAPPSQLKGTMIEVAPPDMQAQMAAARQAAVAKKANSPPPEAPTQEHEPPSEPDPLGGTMVGTSPFAPGGPHAGAIRGGAQDFNDDTPPAGSAAPAATPEALAESSALSADLEAIQAPPPKIAGAPEPYSLGGQADRLPITKSSTGPILLVVLLLLIVAVGVGYLLMGQGDSEEPQADDTASEPAPDAAQE